MPTKKQKQKEFLGRAIFKQRFGGNIKDDPKTSGVSFFSLIISIPNKSYTPVTHIRYRRKCGKSKENAVCNAIYRFSRAF